MAEKKGNAGCIGIVALLAIGFIAGRGSVEDTSESDAVEAAVAAATYDPPAIDVIETAAAMQTDIPSPQPLYIPPPEPAYEPPARQQSFSVYYRNCSEARAAGAAPVMRGDPGYAPKLDRDGDGVGCE
ncbi:excalibur calcium-binding domain-containing protein [Croceibacterium xixiisoli]|nr:excalibur calcium-binding domain-containing protein [Croceibacterium xixiisoli]